MSPSSVNDVTAVITGAQHDPEGRLEKIYYFVRDAIQFDVDVDPLASPEDVLRLARGNYINKAVLLVAMARAARIRCRFKFMWITKQAFSDLLHPAARPLWPPLSPHVFPEVQLNERWVPLEVTFDQGLFEALRAGRLDLAGRPENGDAPKGFSAEGVSGVGQTYAAFGRPAFPASDLTPLWKMFQSMPGRQRRLMTLAARLSRRWLNVKVRSRVVRSTRTLAGERA
jgi:hypothetical protein